MSYEFDLDHLCELARLYLDPEEKERLRPQLEKIVAWVSQLRELPLAETRVELQEELRLTLRPDLVKPSFPLKVVLEAAPEKDESFIKVPRVIEGK